MVATICTRKCTGTSASGVEEVRTTNKKSAGGVGMRKATSVTPSPTKTEEDKGKIKSSGSRFFGWLRFF